MFIAGEDTNFVQLGIVSFGPSTYSSTHPSVYTRITKYMQWIEKNLQGPPYISAHYISVNNSKDEKPVSVDVGHVSKNQYPFMVKTQ